MARRRAPRAARGGAVDLPAPMHTEAFVPALAWALPFAGLLLSIAVLPLAAPHFWESNLRKLGVCALLGAPVLVLYLRAHPRVARARGRGLRVVHRAPGGPVRDLRRHPPRGRPRGDPPHERGVSRPRGAARLLRRDHGRLDAPHPAPAADEPREEARRAHRRVLHLPRLEHRGLPDPARRPAAVPRLPPGRAVHLDVPAVRAVALHHGPGPRRVRRSGTAGPTRARRRPT